MSAAAQPAPVPGLDSGAPRAAAPAVADGYPALEGTSWTLVRYIRADGTVIAPAPGAYTLAFEPGGRLTARLDCNRATGTWSATATGALTLGPLAATRALCPDMRLHDRLTEDAPHVTGYIVDEGRLWLALGEEDEGMYEFAEE